jgi:hypothetical protein
MLEDQLARGCSHERISTSRVTHPESTPMTLRHKLSIVALAASIAGAIALLMSPVPAVQAQSPGGGVTISGTIYGTLGQDPMYPDDPEKIAWVGHAMVSFGNAPALIASFIDRNNSASFKKHGLSGTETISLEFLDGSGGFDIVGRFNVSEASTPGLFCIARDRLHCERNGEICQPFRAGNCSRPGCRAASRRRRADVDL